MTDAEITWAVGTVAKRLGVSASTLRTWERRYEVGPTHYTAGGHRRYTVKDIDRVEFMRRLLDRGVPAREAAKVAHGVDEAGLAKALNSSEIDGEGLNVEESIEALLGATRMYDQARVGRLYAGVLRRFGVVEGWTSVVVPTLIEIGREWEDGTLGVGAEHLASDRLAAALRTHVRTKGPQAGGGPMIVLAGTQNDEHGLPVLALEAALADAGIVTHVFGPRFPAAALATVTERLKPDAVFLWASMPRPHDDDFWNAVAATKRQANVILGGPGWPPSVEVPGDLRATIECIRRAVTA